MRTIAAVVFDLDDTLYPERQYVLSGFAAVAEAFRDQLGDVAKTRADMQRLFDPNRRKRVFNELLAERGLSDSAETNGLVGRMLETYRSHKPKITLHADADTVLARFGERYKIGLITDGRPVQQQAKIDALNLRTRFDEIIVTGELGADCAKPSPAAFELIATRLGAAHAQCVYVADNPAKDFVGPNALGWMTVHVDRPDGIYRNESSPVTGAPDHKVDSLDALVSLIT